MRMFPVCMGGKYMVATKGNKRKSKIFYYKMVGYSGVEFVKNIKSAHTCNTDGESKFIIVYLKKRIREVGFVLREF